jgi:hypothetical protein
MYEAITVGKVFSSYINVGRLQGKSSINEIRALANKPGL